MCHRGLFPRQDDVDSGPRMDHNVGIADYNVEPDAKRRLGKPILLMLFGMRKIPSPLIAVSSSREQWAGR